MNKIIKVYMTNYNQNQLLKEQTPLSFGPDKEGYKANEANIFNIYDQVRYQKILGFGGAMTQASAVNLLKMNEAQRNEVMKRFFDSKEGIGYSLCRTTINSCDFSTEFYNYDNTENDWDLHDFNIEHDRKDVIPMIKQAMTLSDDLTLFSSPWSPPGWMKTNGRMDKGRYLRKDCRQVFGAISMGSSFLSAAIVAASAGAVGIEELSMKNLTQLILVIAAVLLLFCGIQIPLFYALGKKKGTVASLILFLVPVGFLYLKFITLLDALPGMELFRYLMEKFREGRNIVSRYLWAEVVGMVLFYVISYGLSVRFYRKGGRK